MSSQHQLTPEPALGLFGKHPGHGDFVTAGLPDRLVQNLSDFLGGTLGQTREAMGAQWPAIQGATTPLRFWLGGVMAAQGPWQGVLRLSADRVGRHYPLLIARACASDSLPTARPDQGFYQQAAQALDDLLAQPELAPRQAAADLRGAIVPAPDGGADMPPSDPGFWAARASDQVGQLCADMALTDLVAAGSRRSYWWFAHPGANQSGILACDGWPDAQGLAWLLAGLAGGEPGGGEGPEDNAKRDDR